MKRKLNFPPKLMRRIYTDKQIAQALQLLSEIKNNQMASEKTGVPRSTLNQWRIRYQNDEQFSKRIDLFLAESQGPPSHPDAREPCGEVRANMAASHRRICYTPQRMKRKVYLCAN